MTDFRMSLKCLCHKGSAVLGIHTIDHGLDSMWYLSLIRDGAREAKQHLSAAESDMGSVTINV